MGKYTIQPGDTLSEIASANGTTVEEIATLNGIENPDMIYAGSEIDLPDITGTGTPNNSSAPTYTKPTYEKGDDLIAAEGALSTHLGTKPVPYTSRWQTQLDDTINKILNREKFSYDLNGDALYQQYKDRYIQQGKLAMGDAIGQASAMTGGYGNSYAQSVGQQAYQAQLEKLNDIVPELYQMALDKYNMEGQELYNQYSMLGAQDDREFGRHRAKVSDWLTELEYLTGRVDTERNFDYGSYLDAMSDYKWQQEHDLKAANVNVTGGDVTGGDDDTVVDTSGISVDDIKKMQTLLGVDADGKWGPKTTAMAGNLTLEEAYEAWKNGTLKSIDDPEYYEGWDYGDWEALFAGWRNGEGEFSGKAYAEEKLREYIKKGLIPKEYIVAARIGASGSLGH